MAYISLAAAAPRRRCCAFLSLISLSLSLAPFKCACESIYWGRSLLRARERGWCARQACSSSSGCTCPEFPCLCVLIRLLFLVVCSNLLCCVVFSAMCVLLVRRCLRVWFGFSVSFLAGLVPTPRVLGRFPRHS